MAKSTDVLSLLRLLDEIGQTIDYLWGYLYDMSKDGLLPRILDAEEVKNVEELRKIVSLLVKAKRDPTRELTDAAIQELVEIIGDERLDEYFTIRELQRIPGVVTRWKKLRTLQVVIMPGEKVTGYLRQATSCYLYGLFDATAILCRAVLQFTLEEAFAMRGGMSLDPSGRDYLNTLIKYALATKVLSPHLATKAHEIRRVGNNSVHKSTCNQSTALATLKDTGEVLVHIYGRTPRNAK